MPEAKSFLLKWETAKAIAESEPENPPFVVEQVAILGAITSLSAKIKVGKTTLVGMLLKSSVAGHPFLGLETRPTRVLYCTEEGRKTYRAFLKRTSLEDNEDLHVAFLASIPRDLTWPLMARDILAKALDIQANMIIFDTFTRWARIKPEQENDAGAAAQAMEPLELMRVAGLAIIMVFHDRKSGGDVADAARGSSAFGGAADIILNLVNPATNGHLNRRVLSCVSRFDDSFIWSIDLEDGEYILRGDDEGQQVERLDTKTEISMCLLMGPLSREELAQQMRVSSKAGTYRRALEDLEKEGEVLCTGTGHKGSPFVYELASLAKGAK